MTLYANSVLYTTRKIPRKQSWDLAEKVTMPSQKRKRSVSILSSRAASTPSHLPPDAINIHSHSAGTIKQLRTAGLTDNDLLPSAYLPDFPHRSLRQAAPLDNEDDDGDDDHAAAAAEETTDGETTTNSAGPSRPLSKSRHARLMRDAQDHHLAILTATIQRALAEGNIARAHRAFGLVRRAEVHGKPVDLRRNGLWSLGAEVLMRMGEQAGGGGSGTRRWGSTANLPALRAYLEGLVRLYPYNRLHPSSISAQDFYPVLFGCEVYDAWVEYRAGLELVVREWEEGGFDDDELSPPPPSLDEYNGEERERESRADRRLRDERAILARRALAAARDVVTRMDLLMEAAPYDRSVEMLRLRGMAALFLGDLAAVATVDEERGEALRVREEERTRARGFFARMRDAGGSVDNFTERWLVNEDDDDDDDDENRVEDDEMAYTWSALPVFSSLPMR